MASFREAELGGWSKRATSYDELFVALTNQVIAPIVEILVFAVFVFGMWRLLRTFRRRGYVTRFS